MKPAGVLESPPRLNREEKARRVSQDCRVDEAVRRLAALSLVHLADVDARAGAQQAQDLGRAA